MVTNCFVCGKEIYFRPSSRGIFVPRTKATGNIHYEECALKPKKIPEPSPQKEIGEFDK